MRIRLHHRPPGIALIVVLIVVVVLGILAGGFAYSMKVETTLARHTMFSSELDWAGRSGVEIAKWVLSQSSAGPAGQFDSLKQKWAGGPGETNDPLSAVDLKNYHFTMLDGKEIATLSIDIKDMDRKFNVNVADEIILKQALTLIGVDASLSSTVANSILDWRDPDGNTRNGGAESEFYEGMEPPYYAKDGPIDDLSELLLIKGITPAMYWGSSGGGMPAVLNRPNPAQKSQFDEPVYAVGLAELFSPLSSRQVNINTASATVLQIFPDIDANIAQAIITARSGPDGADGTDDDTPFRSPQEIARVPGLSNPAALQALTRYFTVRSLIFEARISIDMRGTRREYVALLRRNGPKDVQTLNLYWK